MSRLIRFKKPFLVTLVVSLIISALIGIVIFLVGEFGEMEAKLLATTSLIAGYSLTGLCCATLYEKKKAKFLPFLGILVSCLGLIYTTLAIWDVITFDSYDEFKPILTFLALAFASAHSCLLLLIDSKNAIVRNSLYATVAAIWIVTIMGIMVILEMVADAGNLYFRFIGVFSILDVLGTIVTPILHRVYPTKN